MCDVLLSPFSKGCEKIREATGRGSGAEVKDVVDLQRVNCNLTRSPQPTRDVRERVWYLSNIMNCEGEQERLVFYLASLMQEPEGIKSD